MADDEEHERLPRSFPTGEFVFLTTETVELRAIDIATRRKTGELLFLRSARAR
ncbi:hypothetical protein [Bradyrhizobium liaoningense]|uniref:hypothetical protein n=1 Tax=Bradyrhizobium liaoningense TaxID=43992 RepID=UPI001BA52023|nr:hypothetical protein [Bradyrhizobium liaoningense]MBR0904608.1 hypothetical protein [Bradyrhizobium liaoningense]